MLMSNFNFIKDDFPKLHADVIEAEQLTFVSPKASAVLMRSVLENAVNWLYENDTKLTRPWRGDLSTLMHEHEFRSLFNKTLFGEINLIRKTGNSAAHGSRIKPDDALVTLKYLFRFLRFLAIYYGKSTPGSQAFEESLIPHPDAQKQQIEDNKKKLKKLIDNLEYKNKKAREDEQKIIEQAKENAELRQKLEQQKKKVSKRRAEREQEINIDNEVPLIVSEAETRRRYIDLSLKEAGWDNLREGYELEYEVHGMPLSTNPSGIGYVDYVLWGDDGLPLAVVEAKKTMADPRKGKRQAEQYADCLEQMHGQRPIIFYSNGFETYIWDDQFYAEREIYGFYEKDELQLLVNRRDPVSGRRDIRQFSINEDITGRAYQLEAIQRLAENMVDVKDDQLVGRARESLLVMATGSGKTRTSASIVDMFTKSNWVKRVLFLADRNALVTQAKNAFNEHLPHLSAIDLTKEKEDVGTRLIFSTYPTIMNRIDGRIEDEKRFYGVGHFDLIIIDEAHRSVYQKYRAIFEYFDAMLIGLTATPKSEVDRNTYSLFGIEDHNPTYAYELEQAVDDGFLVRYQPINLPIKFIHQGIKYKDLSDKEKEEYEEKFGDPSTGEAPDEIPGSELYKWLFNTDTVDKVLDHLMTYGHKVEGGDKLGKTIIFAKNHKHALFIEERFNKNYPEYSGKFLRVIDNYESKAQDLLESFVDPYEEKSPQIAVSVDMMDTGVDAPRVLNLVFFKQVKSPTKFWQMIGRGTRLCPDVYGEGIDKTDFLIFDHCGNFEFFDENPEGIEGQAVISLTQKVFELKLDVAIAIRNFPEATEEQRKHSETYIKELHHSITTLDTKRFIVRQQHRLVTEYSARTRWESISRGDLNDIKNHLSRLVIPPTGDDELARRFDVIMLTMQLAYIAPDKTIHNQSSIVSNISTSLLKKQNIPDIARNAELLKQIASPEYWKNATIVNMEEVRVAIRELLKYLDKINREDVITHFEDEIEREGIRHPIKPYPIEPYRERVKKYIREHKDHLVIQKLNTNKALTGSEIEQLESILFNSELGTREDYQNEYGEKPLGELIREIVGLERNAALAVFAEFLQKGNLTGDQITFINTIINYLTVNGVIDKKMLFESPFTNMHQDGLLGIFDDAGARNVIKLVDSINDSARKVV